MRIFAILYSRNKKNTPFLLSTHVSATAPLLGAYPRAYIHIAPPNRVARFPLAALSSARKEPALSYTHTCKGCGHTFTAWRPQAETCSNACRKRAYRAAHAAREAESLTRLDELLAQLSELATPKEPTP